MFYLKKCSTCKRYGNVALEAHDTQCNLCKGKKNTKEDDTKYPENAGYGEKK